jgi:ketosteroid isomerase-like protein
MPTSVLKSAERALVALDTQALASLYAHDFVFEDTSLDLRVDTKDALAAYFNGLFAWPDVRFSNVSFFAAGDRGAGQWTWEGTSRQSGTPFAIRGASLFRLEEDSIAEEIIFYDPRPAYA